MEPLAHLASIPLSLSKEGPALLTVSSLRRELQADPVIYSPLWDSLGINNHPSRKALAKGWCNFMQQPSEHSPYVRAALFCFDVLDSFINSAAQTEKIHISAFLSIKDRVQGDQGTSDGASLIIEKLSSPQEEAKSDLEATLGHVSIVSCPVVDNPFESNAVYNNSMAFITAMKNLEKGFHDYNEDPDFSPSVIIDINVAENFRWQRAPEDNNEIIALAIITGHMLLRLSGTDSDGSFVRVQPENPVAFGGRPTGQILISAQWPGQTLSVLKQAHDLCRSWRGMSDDFLNLQHLIHNLMVKEGRRNIILLGRTGSGKSHTGNWILRQICQDDSEQFMESESGSMTSFVESLPSSGDYCVWDTPGLDDAYGRDQRYLDDIQRSILEMGTVSVIVMCFTSIERIESSVQKQIKAYANIIGPKLAKRVLLCVNRQSGRLLPLQKKLLIKTMKKEGNLDVCVDQIFDMGYNSQDLNDELCRAWKMLLNCCSQPAMKMSYVDQLHQGLLEIQNLQNSRVRMEAEDELVRLSSELLWFRFGSQNRKNVLVLRPTMRHEFVLSDGCQYLVNNEFAQNEVVVIEHVFELPESSRTAFKGLKIFIRGLGSRNQHVIKLMEEVKRLRLVFMEMPKDKRFDVSGVIQKKLRIRYRLWNVSEALSEDVKQHIQKATGREGETEVSAFPRLGYLSTISSGMKHNGSC